MAAANIAKLERRIADLEQSFGHTVLLAQRVDELEHQLRGDSSAYFATTKAAAAACGYRCPKRFKQRAAALGLCPVHVPGSNRLKWPRAQTLLTFRQRHII